MTMKKRFLTALLVVALPGAGAIIGFLLRPSAQNASMQPRAQTGWAIGTVTRPDGSVVPQAAVTFRRNAYERSVPANKGVFAAELPVGTYSVTATSPNGPVEASSVDVHAGAPSVVQLMTPMPIEMAIAAGERTPQTSTITTRRKQSRREPASVDRPIDEESPVAMMAPPPQPPPPPPAPVPSPEVFVTPTPAPIPAPETAPADSSTTAVENPKTPEQIRCEKEAPGQPCPITVFYGTDRKALEARHRPRDFRELAVYYGADRNLDEIDPIAYGSCVVTIPPVHKKNTGNLQYGEYKPGRAVYLKEVNDLGRDKFLRELNERVDRDGDMIVFIHGYNVSFGEAARRTAQIYYDLGIKAAPVFFSWPSGGHLWDYWADEASVEWSSTHLRVFLETLARQTHAKRIHLIAHSMGNRAMTRALAEIGLKNEAVPPCHDQCPQTNPLVKFNQVVLAAPDLDTDIFLQLRAALQRAVCGVSDGCNAPGGVTLYASRRDRAVLVSWILHRFRRLGFAKANPKMIEGVDEIDATSADTGFLGHSYYSSSVLWDIKLLLDNTVVDKRVGCTVAPPKTPPGYYVFNYASATVKKPNVFVRTFRTILRRTPDPDEIAPKCAPRIASNAAP